MSGCDRVMIMAGGTGGHVFPALSVAATLRGRDIQVNWLGTRKGIESRLVPEHQIPITYIEVQGFRGKGLAALFKAPYLIIKAVRQAANAIKSAQPDVVVGFGGFAAGPGGVAAWLQGIPVVIHEQNAVAGTTNKLLAKIAKRVLTAFPDVLPNSQWIGNPVRNEIAGLADPETRIAQPDRPLRLLVLGGSLGAVAINQLLPQALGRLPDTIRVEVRHQCGGKNQQTCQQAYQEAGVASLLTDGQVEPFIDNMAEAYGWADLVLCRAGALTVSELAAAGVGAILVPYPYAIDDHQTRNGEWLASKGAAQVVQESWLSPERLALVLEEWLCDPDQLRLRGVNARQAAQLNAANQVADTCEELCHD